MKKTFLLFSVIALIAINCSAQENFKVMFYNLLNYPLEDAVPNREVDLEVTLSDYQPDLFLVCELNNSEGANNILSITRSAISSDFEMATYVSNTSDDFIGDQNNLQNLLYYNSSKFILEEEIIVPTYLRDFNIYRLKLNTINQDTNPIELYVIVAHLKASSGEFNEQRRFEMVQDLDAYLNTLPADVNVLLGGDLNLYTGLESAFQELLDVTNNITFTDPANRIGDWNNNASFVDVFTQSTRTESGMGGATGGFDDRFDFILTSQNMIGNSNINYMADSYQVYGNNETASCRNRSINSEDCSGADYSFEIREALHNFSDHLPVTVTLETDATLLSIDEVTAVEKLLLKETLINNELVLQLNSSELYDKTLIIYNSLGKKVKIFRTNLEREQHFNVSDLSHGLYFLRIQDFNPIKFIIAN